MKRHRVLRCKLGKICDAPLETQKPPEREAFTLEPKKSVGDIFFIGDVHSS